MQEMKLNRIILYLFAYCVERHLISVKIRGSFFRTMSGLIKQGASELPDFCGAAKMVLYVHSLNFAAHKQKNMSGALKEVRNRIKSVQSTQQITKAMKMVSAAKLRRAQDAIIQMRPYAKKLQEMLSNIVSNAEGDINMALANERPVEKVLIIVITSDRGLCGGYNSNLIKLAKQDIKEKYAAQFAKGNVEILPLEKKDMSIFQKINLK